MQLLGHSWHWTCPLPRAFQYFAEILEIFLTGSDFKGKAIKNRGQRSKNLFTVKYTQYKRISELLPDYRRIYSGCQIQKSPFVQISILSHNLPLFPTICQYFWA